MDFLKSGHALGKSCISLSKRESSTIIPKLKLLLDKIVMFESFSLSVEDAFIIYTELLHLSKSDQWLQYKNTILNDLIKIYACERQYLQENNELQNNCLNLYKNCQDLEERLQSATKRSNKMVLQQELKPYSMDERKDLIELLRKHKNSLIHNVEALAINKDKFLVGLSNNGTHKFDLNENNLRNSIAGLQNELKTYEQLVELKEESFEKLKQNFHLNMKAMDVDVDDIHALSIKYHELVKQEASEIVQLKNRVYQLQQQIEQTTKVTTISTETTYGTDQRNIYKLMEQAKIYLKEILGVNNPYLDAGTSSQIKSTENIYNQAKCPNNNGKPFRKDKSVQTEDDLLCRATVIADQLKEETHRKQKNLIVDFTIDLKNKKPGRKSIKREDFEEMVNCLKITQKAEEDLKQELELKTMELENLNQVFREQNNHLQKLEKYSMTLELKREQDIANMRKSFQTELEAMRDELDFCRREMKQQSQLIFTLQQAQKVNQNIKKDDVKLVKYRQRLDNIEHKRENSKNLQMLQHIKAVGATTDDNLSILKKILKIEYNRKEDYSCREVPNNPHPHPVSQINKGHSNVFGKYSEKSKGLLDSKIRSKGDGGNSEWFEMDTADEASNLIDDYKKFMQKSAEPTKRFSMSNQR